MKHVLSLLKCTFLATAIFSGVVTVAATTTVASGLDAGAWTIMMLPLPFGGMSALGSLALAFSCASNE